MSSSQPASQVAESVCPGHPDKVADQISDAVLDAHLAQDPYARVNCEVLITRDTVVATGQITARAEVDVEATIRSVLRDVGYDDPDRHGVSAESANVQVLIDRQSREIADGVDNGGAGDSGIMYGYATDETPELMPLSCVLAHGMARGLTATTPDRQPSGWGPDGKVQVAVTADADAPTAVVVVSIQHPHGVDLAELSAEVTETVIRPRLAERGIASFSVHVNPAGSFVTGGPAADAGLTGRKLMVDAYGGLVRHGGGCCSGKDATKVDRSGAYLARYLAANVVAAGLAQRCRIGLAYAIGRPEPVWLDVECFGTERAEPASIATALRETVDLRVGAVIERLALRTTPLRPTATFGHFGRPAENFGWELRDLGTQLLERCGATSIAGR